MHHFQNMKITAIIFGFFEIISFINGSQKIDTIKIEVVNCMSSITYSFDGDSVVIKDKLFPKQTYSSNKVDTVDLTRFVIVAKKMLETKGDEVLDNACVMDGFHIKVYLTINGDKKKIFIGNYYDTRVDSLVTIFDKYINRENEILKYNAFRYSKSPDRIKEMIDDQKSCTEVPSEEMKRHLLHSFCEY
jgi:hypothetical protein